MKDRSIPNLSWFTGLLLCIFLAYFLVSRGYLLVSRMWMPDDGKQNWTEHTFAAGAYQISVPDSWRVEHTDNDGLVLGHLQNNLAIIVSADVKATALAQAPNTPETAITAGSTITELRDVLSAYVTHVWTKSGWSIDNITTTSRSADSVDIVVTGTNAEGAAVRGHQRFIEHGPYWIGVQTWGSLTSYEQHRDTMKQIVDSVRPTR